MTKLILKYLIIPLMVGLEVSGISYYYPICKDTFWKLVVLLIIVFAIHELYRFIINYCETLNS